MLSCGAGVFCKTTASIRGLYQSQKNNLGHPREILSEGWCTPRASRWKHRFNGGRWLANLVCSKGGAQNQDTVDGKFLHHLRSPKPRSSYSGWLCFLSHALLGQKAKPPHLFGGFFHQQYHPVTYCIVCIVCHPKIFPWSSFQQIALTGCGCYPWSFGQRGVFGERGTNSWTWCGTSSRSSGSRT